MMMSQPTSAAWTMLSSSRGLAHSSSIRRPAARQMLSASRISGIGSRPVSAMRPANTETTDGAPPSSARATSRTCSSVQIAVTFSFTPAPASSRDQLGASARAWCW